MTENSRSVPSITFMDNYHNELILDVDKEDVNLTFVETSLFCAKSLATFKRSEALKLAYAIIGILKSE